ncbi:MAG TPA: competence/damage-inducible protein A [Phycisphaerae bacterium]|nr:competence/damage-inducible protein A [Phycisphaerae bacterium]HPS52669.1 competence/damage-inducible protein A [Phycisphaerae bacterium]
MENKAIIISIGNELTSGQGLDTNSAWLSRRLAEKGVWVISHHTVGDDLAAISSAIVQAAEKVGLVIISGGLGPTADDLTRFALADAMGVKLVLDEASLRQIEHMFESWGRAMSQSNRIQAMMPDGATAMENTQGTAPGIKATLGGTAIYVTPGVPREMKVMFDKCILPELAVCDDVILHEIVNLFGAGESVIGEKIQDIMQKTGPVIVGTTVANGLVSVRIISSAASRAESQKQIDAAVAELRRRLGKLVVGVGSEASMSAVVGELLEKSGMTVATAESCTGGLIGKMLTDRAGSSKYYVGGIISYSNEVKQEQLGVAQKLLDRYGAVSEQVAAAMAVGVRERLHCDWGISITGIAGPGGGTDEKPVGLVYTALAGHDGVEVAKNIIPPHSRESVRLRSALTALDALRLKLLK